MKEKEEDRMDGQRERRKRGWMDKRKGGREDE